MKDSKKARRQAIRELTHLWAAARSDEEMAKLLEDFFTTAEILDFTERWHTVKALLEGKTHREVSREVGVSISTVTRAARVLREGKGGFELLWKRLC